jgi:hypothetical protein
VLTHLLNEAAIRQKKQKTGHIPVGVQSPTLTIKRTEVSLLCFMAIIMVITYIAEMVFVFPVIDFLRQEGIKRGFAIWKAKPQKIY